MKVFKNVLSCDKSMDFLVKVCLFGFIIVGTPLLMKMVGTVNNFKLVMIYSAISFSVPVILGILMFLFLVIKESIVLIKK